MRRRQAAGRLGRLGWPDTWLGPCLGWPAALAITPKLNIIPDHHSVSKERGLNLYTYRLR